MNPSRRHSAAGCGTGVNLNCNRSPREKTTIELYQELNTLADNIKQTIDKFQKIHSTIRYNRVHLTTTMKMLTRTILFLFSDNTKEI